MSAVSGTLRTYSLLRDSTLRIVIDIDPRFKATFHQMFPDNDVPIAIAPLAMDFERIEQREVKPGPLCRLAGIWCKESNFLEWLDDRLGMEEPTEEKAAAWLRAVCGVKSRRELDSDGIATEIFHREIREPFMAWMEQTGK